LKTKTCFVVVVFNQLWCRRTAA